VIVTTLPPAPLSRRALLGAGAGAGLLGLLSGCDSARQRTNARPVVEINPDTAVRLREWQATQALAVQYDSALAAASAPVSELRPLRAQLAAQITAFGPFLIRLATDPSWDDSTRRGLAAAESSVAALRRRDLAPASPALARLIASVTASGAQRAVLLGGTPPPPAPVQPFPVPKPPALAALQAALAAENAAVYGYGVLGPQLSGAQLARATADYTAHRARGEALQQQITEARATPAAAAAGYELPFAVTGPATAVRLAALLEDRLACVYANGVQAADTPALRAALADSLQQSALRSLAWRGSGSAFPGLPERGGPH
jgi:hypothetical protein